MMKVCFVFPGQGSQHVGMGREIHGDFPEAKRVFEEASDALGYDVAGLSFNGPDEELNRTFRTQPCILTASIAINMVLAAKGIKPTVVAGHSLGEYSALVCAGTVSFKEAVKLTEKRGRLMQDAVPEGMGLMAAVLGLDRGIVDDICRELKSGYAAAANYNCPGQVVIAGERAAVEEAAKKAVERGARKAIPLAVSVPSHCRLMAGASKALGEALEGIEFNAPAIPLVNNADALFLSDAEGIKKSLVRQLNSPLLWEDSIRMITGAEINTFVEVGPGRVLSGLIKRIAPDAAILNVEDMKSLDKTLTSLN